MKLAPIETPEAITDPAGPNRRRLIASSVLGALWVTLPPLAGFWILFELADIAAFLRTDPVWGFWGYVAVFAITAGLGFLPTYSQAFLGGWVFGMQWGLIGAIMGFTGGAAIGYMIARMVTGDSVDQWLDANPKRKAIRDTLARGSFKHSFLIVTLIRLPPSSPFALTTFALAATRVPFWLAMVATPIGMLPRTAIVCLLAATAAESGESDLVGVFKNSPSWTFWSGLVVSGLVIAAIGHYAKQALDKLTVAAE